MYYTESFTGASLPDKSLCITFDDGPGEHTYAIAKYLYEEGIPATFFVVGKYAHEHPEILQSLKDFGHLIANHTYEHPEMPFYRSINGNVQDQIIRTDIVINKYVNYSTTYFRSPQGKWSEEVASDLNSNILTASDHVGPIGWDIGGIDCYYWQLNRSVEEAFSVYIKEINIKKKGIVVFHDEIADMDYVKPRNKTFELVKLIITKLKADGYSFVKLEEIQSIKEASLKKMAFYIEAGSSKYLTLNEADGSVCYTNRQSNRAEFSLTKLSNCKIAIQSSNGYYLDVKEGEGNRILAENKQLGSTCGFDFIPLSNNQFVLRASNGYYLTIDKNKFLTAGAQYMRHGQVFFYYPKDLPIRTTLKLSQKLELMKKRLQFIKSKILQP
jgi:peptidoglycan/xylan/chitin deacetylase (PgdA/CDA1 family)